MLYSLVALGFVLIFKASGVFNFAQGAMVLFAALAMARIREVDAACSARDLVTARIGDHGDVSAWLIERLVLRHLVNQEGITLLMATLGIAYFLDGFGQTLWGSDIYKIDVGMPKDPVFVAREHLPGRHPDQHGGPVRRGRSRRLLVGAAGAVLPEDRRPGARCARWPTTTRRRSRSAFR